MIRDRQDNYIKHGLSYDDVLLVPKYSDISSRIWNNAEENCSISWVRFLINSEELRETNLLKGIEIYFLNNVDTK